MVDSATVTRIIDEEGDEIEGGEPITANLDKHDESHADVLTINGSYGNATFVNRVDPEPEPEQVKLTINKEWVGSAPEGVNSVSVKVTGLDPENNVVYKPEEYQVTNSTWSLTIDGLRKYTDSGEEIRYFVSEVVPEDAGYYQVNADGTEYNGEELGTAASGQSDDPNELTVTIRNRSIDRKDDLAEPDRLWIRAGKILKGDDGSNIISGHTYSFEITDTNGNKVRTATNDDSGDIKFEYLIFDKSNYSEGGMYTYYLHEGEVSDSVGRAPVVKDNSEYRIDVNVSRSDIRKKGEDGVYYDTCKYEIQDVKVTLVKDILGADISDDDRSAGFQYSDEEHVLSISGGSEGSAAFVNKLGPKPKEYVDLKITKEWKGKTPNDVTSIEVVIHGRNKDGDDVIQPIRKNIDSNNGIWSLMISKADKLLEKYSANDEEIIYSVEEIIPVGAGYVQVDKNGREYSEETISRSVSEIIAENTAARQTAIGGTAEETEEAASDEVSYYVVNLYNRPVKSITVEKSWDNDYGYHAGNAGDDNNDYVVVTLYSGKTLDAAKVNGTVYAEAVRIGASDNWKHTFKDLPVYNLSGGLIEYKIAEEVTSGSQYYKDPVYRYDDDGNITIVNELDDTSLTITKEWIGDDSNLRPASIDVEILARESSGVSQETAFRPMMEFFGIESKEWDAKGAVTLNASNNWICTLDGLVKYVPREDENGKRILTKIEYTVREKATPEGYVTKVEVEEDNKKDTETVTITNTYSASGSATIKGTKEITGRRFTGSDNGVFTAILCDENGVALRDENGNEISAPITRKGLSGIGGFEFAPITYNKVGTYNYIVKETGEGPNITNDQREIPVTVTVTDESGKGRLTTAVSLTAEELCFSNVYTGEGKAPVSAMKTVNGKISSDAAGLFEFELFDVDQNKVIATEKNAANGKVTFIREYTPADLENATVTATYVVGQGKEAVKTVVYEGEALDTVTLDGDALKEAKKDQAEEGKYTIVVSSDNFANIAVEVQE